MLTLHLWKMFLQWEAFKYVTWKNLQTGWRKEKKEPVHEGGRKGWLKKIWKYTERWEVGRKECRKDTMEEGKRSWEGTRMDETKEWSEVGHKKPKEGWKHIHSSMNGYPWKDGPIDHQIGAKCCYILPRIQGRKEEKLLRHKEESNKNRWKEGS